MNTYLEHAETALARYVGEVAARSVLQEHASALGVSLGALNAQSYPGLVDRVAGMLEELVGRKAATDFRQAAVQSSPAATRQSLMIGLWRIALVVLGLAALTYAIGGWEYPAYGVDLLQGIMSSVAFVFLVRAARQSPAGDRSWGLLAAGMGLNACGFLYYWGLEVFTGVPDPFPSAADSLWLLSSLTLIAGVVWALLRLRHYGLVRRQVASVRSIGAAVIVAAVLLAELSFFRVEPSDLGFAITLAYPVADLITIAAALMVLGALQRVGRGRLAIPWRIIAVGTILATASDLLYAILRSLGSYQSGSLTDLGWLLQSLLMTWAALEMGALHLRE